jgi:MSHA type pilus biogenesis protein MshL
MKHLFKNLFLFFLLFAFLIFWPGCSVHQPTPVTNKTIDDIRPKEVLGKERLISPPPPPFKEELKPVATGLTKDARLYSMVFDYTPFGEVIHAMNQDSDLNLAIESDIDLTRTITVHLKDVTLEEALDMVVVKGAGYAWKIENESLYINKFEERIYQLDYLDMLGETDIETGGDMLASGVEGSGVAGKYKLNVTRSHEITDVWAGVQTALEGLKSEDGILQINRTAGIIYMADTPKKVASMVQFLDSLSESLHRQVFIEAKIMEVILNDENKYGIDWTSLWVYFTSQSSALPDALDISLNNGGALILSDQSSVSGIVDFLHTQGDVSVLSNPHLSVMNGQSAMMTVGFQLPYGDVEGVDRDTETDVITFGTTIKRAILGLQLGITPQISEHGIVTLHIVPTLTRIQEEVDVEIPTTATSTLAISNPVIDLQELATTVRVRQGNSVVLAGLISQIKRLEHEGLPILSGIPLLGNIFKHIEETEESRELVIYLTPYIKDVE